MDKFSHHLRDHLTGRLNGGARSGHWHTLRNQILVEHPVCALCGGKEDLEVHHILPFHLHPELELDKNNLIVLCEATRFGINCHLFMGHLGNFKGVNPYVREDADYWAPRIKKHLADHGMPLPFSTVGGLSPENIVLIQDPA